MKRLIFALFSALFVLLQALSFGAADDIARLYTFSAGTTIQSSQVNGEFDQIISTINNKFGRGIANTVTGNNTFSGTSTFSGAVSLTGAATFSDSTGVTTNTITERTAASGVTVDGLLIKDGDIEAIKASQAEQETGTSTTKYVTTGRQKYHPGMPKAWVKWNGTGTTIIASHNVTSVTHPAAGQAVVTFTTGFSASDNFSCVGSSIPNAGVPIVMGISNYSGSTVDISTRRVSDFAETDSALNTLSCWGDQ